MNMSRSVTNLFYGSCAKSTWLQYEGIMKKYYSYCNKISANAFKPNLNVVLDFLSSLFESKLGYSYLNTARSGLSTLLPTIDGFKIGEHPSVVRLLKGVGRLRPPKCRYDLVWDVSKVLNLFKSWPNNEDMSLRRLSLKLVGLLALVTAQRCQTLCSIKVENIVFSSFCQIKICDQMKTFDPHKSQPVLKLMPYDKDPKLCVVNCLKAYLQITKPIRWNNESYLFVSSVTPHKRVCTQTISKWLSCVLSDSGIDTTVYKGQSYRHASTSKAAKLGVSIDTIFNKAGWSGGSSVFGKFYNKPIVDSEYSTAILQGTVD